MGLKSLQDFSADDINRRHFQMQFFFLCFFFFFFFLGGGGGILRVKMDLLKSWNKFVNALRCPDI